MEIVDFEADAAFWERFDEANGDNEVFWFFQEAGDPPPYRDSFEWGIALHPRDANGEAALRSGIYFAVRRVVSGLLGLSPVPRTWEFASARSKEGEPFLSSYIFFTSRVSRDAVRRALPAAVRG